MEFWTYGCINCQHVIPALQSWHSAYAGNGTTMPTPTRSNDFSRSSPSRGAAEAATSGSLKLEFAGGLTQSTINNSPVYRKKSDAAPLTIDR